MIDLFPKGLVGVILDCDGVMIDSAAANRYLYNTVLRALGKPAMTSGQELYAFQATFRQALKALAPEVGDEELGHVTRAVIDYDRDILPKIKLMPGFLEFVDKARAKGLRLAVDSNRTAEGVRKVLDFFHLPNYFEPLISCDVAIPKPSADGPEKISEAWACEPRQTLFVGDSPDDRSAARGAGAAFAGFGGLAGDISVTSWPELEAILWPCDNN